MKIALDSGGNSLELCRDFRKNPTEAEVCMWECLRDRKLSGYKFRRQHPFNGYVLDFYCPELKLAIEIDGQVHRNAEQVAYDQERTKNLQEIGISILRFWNSEVKNDLPSVVVRINTFINQNKH
jgi:very-short-patch-repair endonuclease